VAKKLQSPNLGAPSNPCSLVGSSPATLDLKLRRYLYAGVERLPIQRKDFEKTSPGGGSVRVFRCVISHIYEFYTKWNRAGPQSGDGQSRCAPPLRQMAAAFHIIHLAYVGNIAHPKMPSYRKSLCLFRNSCARILKNVTGGRFCQYF